MKEWLVKHQCSLPQNPDKKDELDYETYYQMKVMGGFQPQKSGTLNLINSVR